ncbi:hypothetical protein BSZ25_26945 [Bradyrhizobium canariense]|nr:hypothetical protein BSZ23_25335 [Bradyrhizobium canariense]OSI87644.1 hypothetical protein BSZ25_26945 [Bradyrhizobium canariense]
MFAVTFQWAGRCWDRLCVVLQVFLTCRASMLASQEVIDERGPITAMIGQSGPRIEQRATFHRSIRENPAVA